MAGRWFYFNMVPPFDFLLTYQKMRGSRWTSQKSPIKAAAALPDRRTSRPAPIKYISGIVSRTSTTCAASIHGFGFASALGALNLSGASLAVALLGFNLGIEAAQVVLVLVTMPLLYLLGAGRWVLWSGSAAAAAVGAFWLIQRLPGLI